MEINVFELKLQWGEIHGCISQKALLVPWLTLFQLTTEAEMKDQQALVSFEKGII